MLKRQSQQPLGKFPKDFWGPSRQEELNERLILEGKGGPVSAKRVAQLKHEIRYGATKPLSVSQVLGPDFEAGHMRTPVAAAVAVLG